MLGGKRESILFYNLGQTQVSGSGKGPCPTPLGGKSSPDAVDHHDQ